MINRDKAKAYLNYLRSLSEEEFFDVLENKLGAEFEECEELDKELLDYYDEKFTFEFDYSLMSELAHENTYSFPGFESGSIQCEVNKNSTLCSTDSLDNKLTEYKEPEKYSLGMYSSNQARDISAFDKNDYNLNIA